MSQPEDQYPSSLLYLLFFLSGLTSLVYEIVWGRILATILGNTSLAIAIVVSIFMAGLAAGSFLAVRTRLQFVRPLFAYGVLEGAIGVYAIFTPHLAKTLDLIYSNSYSVVSDHFLLSVFLKGILSALLLLLPTVAMGASLPILIRLYPSEEKRKHASRLYGVNTAGAVAGTLLSGYFLLPRFGITRTIFYAAAANAAIAIIALLTNRRTTGQTETIPKTRFRAVYILFLLSGFASLAYEILWTRALTMYFGSSVYAFAAILAAFLVGIAAGSAFYSGRIPHEADAFQFYSLIQFRLALAAMFFVGIFMGIPVLLIKLFQTFYFSFPLFQTGQFFLIGACIFYATFVSGATFPAALHFFRKENAEMPAHTAYLYAYSTIGGILGSSLAGFLLIPALGVERSIRVIVLLNLLLGIFCFRRTKPERQDRRVLAMGGVALALLLFLPAWNRSIFNAGFYAFAYKYVPGTRPRSELRPADNKPKFVEAALLPHYRAGQELNLLYYGEGLTATVAVAEDERGIRSLLINGKPDASNVPTGDMRTQLLLGHLPVLLKGNVQDALVIGLGSGVTAGALQQHHPRRIDCVEIEKKVAQAAVFFEAENLGILRDSNFHLIFDDGRNFIQHSRKQYDIITSEPSNLWMSGVANLFTLEFFQAAKKRLRPDGVICQWIHLYQISPDDILIFIKTLQSVFPHLSIWIDDTDMLIVGSNRTLPIDAVALAKRMSEPDVEQSLLRSDLTPPNLLKKYVSDERIIKLLRTDVPVNTDDHPILEFSAPQSLFWNRSAEITAALRELKRMADQAGL